VDRELSFAKRFFEMAGPGLTVAAVGSGIGFPVKKFFNPNV
jgi:hypothetical protein